ncbi:MAG TPA: FkbM family methyltransferase [Cyclobacteriaceae bacterium]
MNIKQRLKNKPTLYAGILSILNAINYFNIRFNIFYPKYKLSENWRKRIELVKASDDNNKIVYDKDAGTLHKNHQVMHNGLKITLGSYYDYGNTVLIKENKGVHEPQEEYVFQEVLKHIPEGACMFELGSYWAFYSMWFASVIKKSKCFMIEPDPHKMNFGKLNFKLNKLQGTFDLGFIDQQTNLKSNIPTYSVDYLVEKHQVEFIHVLHSDIQGYEYKMLNGAMNTFKAGKIAYVFISTHSNELHYQCEDFLSQNNFEILCSADLDETFSWDGLLVARNKNIVGPGPISISKRNKN